MIRERVRVRALESPVRQEIVDAVASGGACTMAQIGSWLGRRPDTLYYHVTALVKVGLLKEVGRQRAGKRFCAVYDVPARPVFIGMGGGVGGEDVARVIRSALRVADRDLRRSLAAGEAVSEGPGRNFWGGRVRGWVKSEDLERVGALLDEIAELIQRGAAPDAGVDGGELGYSFTYVAAPVAARSKRRGGKQGARVTRKGAKE